MGWETSDERPEVGLRHRVGRHSHSRVDALDLDAKGQAGISLQAQVRAREAGHLQGQTALEVFRGPSSIQVKTHKCICVRELTKIGARATWKD